MAARYSAAAAVWKLSICADGEAKEREPDAAGACWRARKGCYAVPQEVEAAMAAEVSEDGAPLAVLDVSGSKDDWLPAAIEAAVADASLELAFPDSLPSSARKALHGAAEEAGLSHSSRGDGRRRYLSLMQTPPPSQLLSFAYRRYIAVEGSLIMAAAAGDDGLRARLPSSMRRAQERRDGSSFHLTLINRVQLEALCEDWLSTVAEVKNKADAIARLFSIIASASIDDVLSFTTVGAALVRAAGAGDRAFAVCRIIRWPWADALREQLGLPPHDFHITLAFHRADVHNVPKRADAVCEAEELCARVDALLADEGGAAAGGGAAGEAGTPRGGGKKRKKKRRKRRKKVGKEEEDGKEGDASG